MCYCTYMTTNTNKARLVTYVTEAEHEKLRLEAARQRTSVAAHLRKVVGDHVALLGGTMTDNETHLSMAMSHLRKITSEPISISVASHDSPEGYASFVKDGRRTPSGRAQDYVDAIELELERIKRDMGLR